MENFVVSARKYRPITFESVVGQEHITTTLKNAVATQHLAQAFLFCGPRGVGKTTCARILAKTINCQNLTKNTEPCGQCDSCQSFQNNASFNIHELDAASNNSVEDIRSLIDQVRYPPSSGKYKIYIIDEVHMLSSAAFNAFLKTLEEPPSYAIFILATTEKHKILPTILSRCQNFDFNRIKVADMAAHLQKIADSEGITAEPMALELIAQKADGGLRDALSMFDLLVTYSANNTLSYKQAIENLHILDYDYYFKITEQLQQGQQAAALITLDEILKKGFDGHLFLVGFLEHLRNILLCKDSATITLLEVTESIQKKYLEQAQASNYSFLLSALSIGSGFDINYKSAKNQRLHLEICLLKIANIKNLINIEALVADEKKNSSDLETSAPLAHSAATPIQQSAEITSPSPVVNMNPAAEPSKIIESPRPAAASPGALTKSILKSTKIQVPVAKTEVVVPQENTNTEQSAATAEPDRIIQLADIQPIWQQYIKKLESEERFSDIVIINRPFSYAEGIIDITLESDLQKSIMVERVQEELTELLRKSLAKRNLRIQITVNEEVAERKSIYTQAEKYNYMLGKNADLQYFKTELGLDYEF